MNRKIILLQLLIVFVGAAQLPAQKSTSDPALSAFREGDFDKAIQLYSDMLAEKSGDENLKFNLGSAFYKKGTFNAAKSGFEDALRIEDSQTKSKVYYNLGNTLFKMNKPEESLEAFKRAIKLNPKDEDAKYNYEFVKSLIEEQESDQEGDENEEKESEDSEEKDETDKNEDDSDKNEEEQDKENEQQQENQNQQDQRQQQKEKEKSQADYQDILDALEQEEMQALKEYISARTVKKRQPEKDW